MTPPNIRQICPDDQPTNILELVNKYSEASREIYSSEKYEADDKFFDELSVQFNSLRCQLISLFEKEDDRNLHGPSFSLDDLSLDSIHWYRTHISDLRAVCTSLFTEAMHNANDPHQFLSIDTSKENGATFYSEMKNVLSLMMQSTDFIKNSDHTQIIEDLMDPINNHPSKNEFAAQVDLMKTAFQKIDDSLRVPEGSKLSDQDMNYHINYMLVLYSQLLKSGIAGQVLMSTAFFEEISEEFSDEEMLNKYRPKVFSSLLKGFSQILEALEQGQKLESLLARL